MASSLRQFLQNLILEVVPHSETKLWFRTVACQHFKWSITDPKSVRKTVVQAQEMCTATKLRLSAKTSAWMKKNGSAASASAVCLRDNPVLTPFVRSALLCD